jgi:hypothetical protein
MGATFLSDTGQCASISLDPVLTFVSLLGATLPLGKYTGSDSKSAALVLPFMSVISVLFIKAYMSFSVKS